VEGDLKVRSVNIVSR